ncbi:hypothetical protein FHW64_006439 [Variovorax sp. Sphag1AA]|nr:hypothetical protein [Variovorax sp. Sphag1AA]
MGIDSSFMTPLRKRSASAPPCSEVGSGKPDSFKSNGTSSMTLGWINAASKAPCRMGSSARRSAGWPSSLGGRSSYGVSANTDARPGLLQPPKCELTPFSDGSDMQCEPTGEGSRHAHGPYSVAQCYPDCPRLRRHRSRSLYRQPSFRSRGFATRTCQRAWCAPVARATSRKAAPSSNLGSEAGAGNPAARDRRGKCAEHSDSISFHCRPYDRLPDIRSLLRTPRLGCNWAPGPPFTLASGCGPKRRSVAPQNLRGSRRSQT